MDEYEAFIKDYVEKMKEALDMIDIFSIKKAIEEIKRVKEEGKKILIIGNGGSSSTATHFASDLFKTSEQKIKAISLVDNIPLITALANDFSFSDIFSYQIDTLGETGDLLIIFSVHGGDHRSDNLVKAVYTAKQKGIKTCVFVGFDGGRLKELADLVVHIPINSTGHVESIHVFLHHLITFALKEGKR